MLASGERGAHRKATPFGADGGLCGLSAQPRHRRQIHSSDARAGQARRMVRSHTDSHRLHHADARHTPFPRRHAAHPAPKKRDLFAMARTLEPYLGQILRR